MQANYKSLADIKKRINVVNSRSNQFTYTPLSTTKNMPAPLALAADVWLYRIVIAGLCLCILKVFSSLFIS